MHGGFDENGALLDDSWIWDGGAWHDADPPPFARIEPAFGYDGVTGRVMLHGGDGTDTSTYLWDGDYWERRDVPGPPSRSDAKLAYDPVRNVTVYFGGRQGVVRFADTWVWDGTAWTNANPPTKPPARQGHGMTFDPARGAVVMFGGDSSTGLLSDMWEWGGSDWVDVTPNPAPPSFRGHGMVTDFARQTMHLVTGSLAIGFMNRVYSWDGSGWAPQNVSQDPTQAGTPGRVAFDSVRNRIVAIVGGGGPQATETWEWNGVDWTRRTNVSTPHVIRPPDLAFDESRGVTVMRSMDGTWEYGGSSLASVTTFGTSCSSSVGLPVLSSDPISEPYIGGIFGSTISNTPPAATTIGIIGFSNSTASWGVPLPADLTIAGMPGCFAHVDFGFSTLLASGANSVDWSLTIGDHPNLVGVSVYLQALIAETSPARLATTNALELVIGQ